MKKKKKKWALVHPPQFHVHTCDVAVQPPSTDVQGVADKSGILADDETPTGTVKGSKRTLGGEIWHHPPEV